MYGKISDRSIRDWVRLLSQDDDEGVCGSDHVGLLLFGFSLS